MAIIWDDAHVNVHLDGNSNIASSQTDVEADKFGMIFLAADPLNGNVSARNWAQGGDTWQTMTGGGSSGIQYIHAAFVPGKQNILIVGEDFNTAVIHKSIDIVLSARQAYIDAVKAVHPEWRILCMTMPAGRDDDGVGYNEIVDQSNAYLRANWAAMGLEGYIETRPPGGPFDFGPPYISASGNFGSTYYLDGTHWSRLGNETIVGYITAKLKTLPDVAPVGGQGNAGGVLKRGRGSAMIGRF